MTTTYGTTPLTSFPLEVLVEIATHLDVHSASQLALACKALQEPAENRVWRTVRINHSDIIGNSFSPSINQNVNASDDQMALQPLSDEEKELCKTYLGAWALSSRGLFNNLQNLLSSQPWRYRSVKTLDLELRHEIPLELRDLLRSTRHTLVDLIIHFPADPACLLSLRAFSNLTHCHGLFSGIPSSEPLIALKKIHVDIQSHWFLSDKFEKTLMAILKAAPNLQELRIDSPTLPRSSTSPNSLLGTTMDLPPSLNLRKVVIKDIHESYVPLLAEIVRRSSKLDHVALFDEATFWRPGQHDELLLALGQCQSLKTLKVTSHCMNALTDWGFAGLEQVVVNWDAQMLEQQKDKIIPPLPNLKRYIFNVSPCIYSSTDILETFSPQPRTYKNTIDLSSDIILNQLYLAPSLATIYCPSGLNYNHLSSHTALSLNVSSPAFEGMMIYSYHSKEGEELIHCRSRTTPSEEDWRMPSNAGWEEHAIYDGKTVPIRVLAAVYGLTGICVTDKSPERGMALPEEGWRLLRRWRGENESWS